MTRKKCAGTAECALSPRSVCHLKDCPQRERSVRDLSQLELDKLHDSMRRGETVLVPQSFEVSLDDLITAAEKEKIGDVSHGMTVTYDTSPLPEITVKRGGIRWPLFWVGVKVFSQREGFWRRKRWYVEITERRGGNVLVDTLGPMPLASAQHVKTAVDSMTAMHNDMHEEAVDAWSRS